MSRRDGEHSDDAAVAALLPGCVAALQSRGQRLGGHGWDINLLILLADDAAALAAGCRRIGEEQLAARLHELAIALAAFVDPPILPDLAAGAAIAALLDALSAQPLATPAATAPRPRSTPIQRNGFATAVSPPADYFLRWRTDDAAVAAPLEVARSQPVDETPATVDAQPVVEPVARITPGIEPDAAPPLSLETVEPAQAEVPIPSPAIDYGIAPEPLVQHEPTVTPLPTAAPEPVPEKAAAVDVTTAQSERNAYHLGGGDELDTAIGAHLVTLGYSVEHLEHAGEVEEVLRGLPAHLVIIGAPFEDYLDAIGEEVKQARDRVTWPIPLIALSNNADLDARLRALRAGCDALIGLPAPTAKVLQRMTDAVGAEQVDPYRVMIIDDDRQQALFAEAILRKAGMHTLAVTEALVALEKIEDFMPELILVDLYMPSCNGLELTALIRQNEEFISTPIVFLSGEEDTNKHYEALSVGGDDFLAKPIRPQHLISAVTSRVRRARQLQRQYLPMVAVQDIPTGVTATIATPAPPAVAAPATPAPVRENAVLAAAQRIRTLLAREDAPLELAFQPIVSLQGEENEQFQVLLRLCDVDQQVFSAAQILPVAAAEGLMPRIDRWVVERCVAMIAAQEQNGTPLRLFATVSLDSIGDAEFADWLAGLLRNRPIRSGALVVDLHMGDADDAVAPLARFAATAEDLGLLLALSGYDADYDQHPDVAALPVDFIKLSARYVAEHDAAMRAELISLVKHAHKAGQRVIAPRVEDATTTAALWSAGVDYIQGHFVQKPAQDLSFDFHATVT